MVTDGFTGNVALKTAEGVARFIGNVLQRGFTSSLQAKLGAAIAYPALKRMRARIDPSSVNGGPLLGSERHRGEEPWRRRRQGLRQRAEGRRRPGGQPARGRDRRQPCALDSALAEKAEAEAEGMTRGAQRSDGIGRLSADQIVTNDDLAKVVDTSDAWIRERTGIRQRHRAAEGRAHLRPRRGGRAQRAGGCGPHACRRRPDHRGHHHARPDLSGDRGPGAGKLGAPICPAFDVQAVCSGFVYALSVADGFVARGLAKCALVIGAEDDDPADGLHRPGHLRAVRRRRGRRGPGAGRGQGDHRATAASSASPCAATGPSRTSSTSTAARPPPAPSASCACSGNQVFRHAVVNIAEAVRPPPWRRAWT